MILTQSLLCSHHCFYPTHHDHPILSPYSVSFQQRFFPCDSHVSDAFTSSVDQRDEAPVKEDHRNAYLAQELWRWWKNLIDGQGVSG